MLQGPGSNPDAIRELHAAIADLRPLTVRTVNYTKAHQPFHCELRIEPIFDSDDSQSVVHFVGILRPFTPGALSPLDAAASSSLPHSASAISPRVGTDDGFAPKEAAGGKAAMGKGSTSGEGQSRSTNSVSSIGLLGREAFPLQTLKNHPVAPVLLRMLQLNKEVSPETLNVGDIDVGSLAAAMGGGGAAFDGGRPHEDSSQQGASMEVDPTGWAQREAARRQAQQQQQHQHQQQHQAYAEAQQREQNAQQQQRLAVQHLQHLQPGQLQQLQRAQQQQRLLSTQGGRMPSVQVAQPLPTQAMLWPQQPDGGAADAGPSGAAGGGPPADMPAAMRSEAWLAAVSRQGVLALESFPPVNADGGGGDGGGLMVQQGAVAGSFCSSGSSERRAVQQAIGGQAAMGTQQGLAAQPVSLGAQSAMGPQPGIPDGQGLTPLSPAHGGPTSQQLAAGGWLAANGFGNLEGLQHLEGLQQGIQHGMHQGLQQGMNQGMQQGLQQGVQQGLPQGLQQGMQQGMQQGLQQGVRQAAACVPQPQSVGASSRGPPPTCGHAQQHAYKRKYADVDDYAATGAALGAQMGEEWPTHDGGRQLGQPSAVRPPHGLKPEEALQGGSMQGGLMLQAHNRLIDGDSDGDGGGGSASSADVLGAFASASSADVAELAAKLPRGLGELLADDAFPMNAGEYGSIESELCSLGGANPSDELELDGVLNVLERWERLEKPDCECQ